MGLMADLGSAPVGVEPAIFILLHRKHPSFSLVERFQRSE